MPKKRKTTRRRKASRVYHVVKRNPDLGMLGLANPRGGRIRRAYSRAKSGIGKGLSFAGIGAALKNAIPATAGILCANVARKRWGAAASNLSPWQGKDYLAAALGTMAGSMIAKGLFKVSSHTADLINVGGLALILNHLIQDQIVTKSPTLQNWIGQEPGEGSWTGEEPYGYLPGSTVTGEDGGTYVMGEDAQWRPVDESHRIGGTYGADQLVNVGPLGDVTSPPGPLGFGADPYKSAYPEV